MSKTSAHLERAKEYLTIAESDNPRREAYIKAAEAIAAHRQETGDTWNALARALGRHESKLRLLDKWRREGYQAETPYLMDEKATDRAALSHARKVLREHPEEVAKEIAQAIYQDPQVRLEVRLAETRLEADQVDQAQRREREEYKGALAGDEFSWRSLNAHIDTVVRGLMGVERRADEVDWTESRTEHMQEEFENWSQSMDRIKMVMQSKKITDEDIQREFGGER